MIQFLKTFILAAIFIVLSHLTYATAKVWKVSKTGNGQFTSIQSAIDQIPTKMHDFIIIEIDAGVYKEKLFIQKNNFELVGAGIGKTVITQSIARDVWRCENINDWGVATVNVDSCKNINFKNLTIENTYGFEHKEAVQIPCVLDTAKFKWVHPTGHQMAFRSFNATQIKFVNCHFRSFGGDTMSPWNTTDGMFFLKDCILEGGVDFYCPRGWAYAENCTFISHSGTAAIWHDGSLQEDAKSVFVNCQFKGFDGFNLGRYHRDAQFYLIQCHFDSNMSQEDIFQVKTTNTLSWPRRVYYYDCEGGHPESIFFKNNLQESKGNPKASEINATWVFKDKWNPLLQ